MGLKSIGPECTQNNYVIIMLYTSDHSVRSRCLLRGDNQQYDVLSLVFCSLI